MKWKQEKWNGSNEWYRTSNDDLQTLMSMNLNLIQ